MVEKENKPDAEPAGNGGAGSSDGPSPKIPAVEPEHDPKVVYRRVDPVDGTAPPSNSPSSLRRIMSRQLAPAVMPLVIGFLLLLILIFVLAYLSVQQMDEVGNNVLNLEQVHAAKLGLLLKLRLATTKLNNEARVRAESEARGGLRPPFDMRLIMAQQETHQLMKILERPPFRDDPSWQKFSSDLKSFIEVTDDLRRYSLEGFDKFNVVDSQLNAMLDSSAQEQADVFLKSEALEQEAARSIRTWSVIALIVGALVAAGTIWEVQRRFGEMRRSMEEARRERVFTSQLLEGMVSAVAAVDENDRIRSANAAFFRIFPGATIGASVYEKFASDAALKMLEAATATHVEKATYRGRWVGPTTDDGEHERTFDVYSSPLAMDGARGGQVLTLMDVTEVAEAERGMRRQESLAAVGQATAQVAHEIRNPLGSIRLGVSMLRDNVTDQEGLNTIELVERGIKHLNKLVVDVAQFSRRKALEQSNVDLNDLLNRSLELVADKIKDKDTPIEKKLSDQKMVGHWDPDQLRQVFVNVVGNAIDASPAHAPITISTEAIDLRSDGNGHELATKRHARVTVADRGKGMDPATIERIFEPFFSTKKRGTGLGLAIVKQIVEQHGGRIGVESQPEKGTSFVIDLPL